MNVSDGGAFLRDYMPFPNVYEKMQFQLHYVDVFSVLHAHAPLFLINADLGAFVFISLF